MHTLLFDKEFKKDLDKLDTNLRDRVLKKIRELKKYPELGKHLVGMDLWSLRIGKYRVLYKIIHEKAQVLLLTFEHRKEAYRDLR